MRKFRPLLIIITAASTLLAACESGVVDNSVLSQNFFEPEYWINISTTDNGAFPAGISEGKVTVALSHNLEWTATASDTWITLSPTSGRGNAVVTFTLAVNHTANTRTGTIVFTTREKSVSLSVSQEGIEGTGTMDNHQYVSLGLPSGTLWATTNVGASSPEEYGDYFAWGETMTKTDFSWKTYRWCNGTETSITKYNTSSEYGTVDNKIYLELSDDAARQNWGGSWCTPTNGDWAELRDECIWTWTKQGGYNGYKVASKTNGNSIFLPAAGFRWDTSLYTKDNSGYYWSASLLNYSHAWIQQFESGKVESNYIHNRFSGLPVRPVWRP